MKLAMKLKLTGGALAGVLLMLGMGTAQAAPIGTAAGTSVTNKATVNYQVGGVNQTLIESSPTGNTTSGVGNGANTSFVVDDKLVLVVTRQDGAIVSVSPGQTNVVLVYQVTNNGNATQGVSFTTLQKATATANPFGAGTDNFDATAPTTPGTGTPSIFVSQNNTATYVLANDTASSIPQLASGDSHYVFVVASIPSGQADGSIAVNALVAQVAVAGGSATYGTAPGANITADDSGTAWSSSVQQNIFADAGGTDDAANDGKSSDRDAWMVASAKLTITKTAAVVTDPVNCTTPGNTGSCTGTPANFKSIPGSVMQYTVTVHNDTTATANASAISVADDLNTQIATNGYIAWFANSLNVTAAGVNTGTQFNCADGAVHNEPATGGAPYTAVSCDWNQTTTNTVTVTGITLKPNDTATITYEVTIQ
ncbi:MAG TPA: hypothetical protein VFM15_07420 [Gammaproteobacteria bacterium]|nr:hypothetical protein [Gammaproteobacteria bacterium]